MAEGRLFTMGHVEGKEFLYCLDCKTGETIWSHSYECALVDNLHDGGPGSTPTLDGDRVYALGREGQLFCLRAATGELVWSKLLQTDLGVEMPEWGFTSSPRVLGNQLILEAGRVVSYDKHTGKKNWQTPPHKLGYGSVASFENKGNVLLASLDCDGLRIVQADDGEEVAFEPWESPYQTNSTTPIVHEDRLFISTGYNVGCGLFQLVGSKLEPVYTNRDMCNHFNNCILLDGYLYGMDGNSHSSRNVKLTCMNFDTGEVAWTERGFGCGSLMIADGKLIILSEEGTLIVAEASAAGFRELCRSPFLEGRCWTVPVMLDGRVYGRNAAGKLVCLALPTAK
ncbi:MAG: PQQ-like beta-propeller repeat protein [Planctomycetales bacterium]|nr:PQQ-like beta-propeller repeat protein [Planctomycetales bacterium]